MTPVISERENPRVAFYCGCAEREVSLLDEDEANDYMRFALFTCKTTAHECHRGKVHEDNSARPAARRARRGHRRPRRAQYRAGCGAGYAREPPALGGHPRHTRHSRLPPP